MMYSADECIRVMNERNQRQRQSEERKQILDDELMTNVLIYVGNVSSAKVASSVFIPTDYITSVIFNNNATMNAIDSYMIQHTGIRNVEFVDCAFIDSCSFGRLIDKYSFVTSFVVNRCPFINDISFFTNSSAIGTTFSQVNGLNETVTVEFRGNWKIFPIPTPSMTPAHVIDIARASVGTGNFFGHLWSFVHGSIFRFNDYKGYFVSMFNDPMFKILCIDYRIPDEASVFIRSSNYDTLVCVLKKKENCWLLNTVLEKRTHDCFVSMIEI